MSNFLAIYLFSAVLVLIGTIRHSNITMSSPIIEHISLLISVSLAPIVLFLNCCLYKREEKEKEE